MLQNPRPDNNKNNYSTPIFKSRLLELFTICRILYFQVEVMRFKSGILIINNRKTNNIKLYLNDNDVRLQERAGNSWNRREALACWAIRSRRRARRRILTGARSALAPTPRWCANARRARRWTARWRNRRSRRTTSAARNAHGRPRKRPRRARTTARSTW